ncbi:MAG: PhnD/SsuA/transferrin family substrate-binding protein [Pseudomonadota bacterium]
MIASLPMYDRPETFAANDALWTLIRDAFRSAGADAPDGLTREGDIWAQWTAPDLVLSQTCGLPLATRLWDDVTYIGAPVFDIECAPGHYFSRVVMRKDDLRDDLSGTRLAFNDTMSQSGWAAANAYASANGFAFRSKTETGAHRVSAQAVAEGRADIAFIDAVTWEMIRRWDDCAQTLRMVDATPPTPALPYIAALGADADVIFQLMLNAFAQLSGSDRQVLCLKGITRLPRNAYLRQKPPDRPH